MFQKTEAITIDTPAACKLLGVSEYTLKDKAKRGIIPGFKAGRSWQFYVPDLIEYMQSYAAARKAKAEIGERQWQSTERKAPRTSIHALHSVVSQLTNRRAQLRDEKRKSTRISADAK